jgi:tetratricopeptide (TPR) repeat protein
MKAHALVCILLLSPVHPVPAEELDQARELYWRGEFHQVVDVLSRRSQSFPADPDVRLWLGKSLIKVQRWDDAVKQLEKAVELQPNSAVCYLWLGRACGGRASHSSWFTAPGWAKRVIKAFETARRLAPENLDVRFDLMDYYLQAPRFLGGGHDKAEAEASTIAKLSPVAGYTARALIFEHDNKWDQARDELVSATAEFSSSAHAYVDLADYLLTRFDYSGAEADARKALLLEPGLPKARLIRAAAQIRLGKDLSDAETSLKTLSQGSLKDEDPTFEETYYWLGEAYLARGKRQEARDMFETALRYNPDYDKARSALSRIR